MNLPLARPAMLAALFILGLALTARAADSDTPPTDIPGANDEPGLKLEDHAIDAKVKEIIKNSKSPEDAMHSLRQLVMQNPNNADLWFQVAEACFAMHDAEKAISAYKHCLALDPKRKGVWNTIAILYYTAGDRIQALEALTNALKIDPDDVDALNSSAIITIDMGKLDAASALLDKAKALDPKSAKLWSTTGQIAFRRKQWPQALDAYNKALELDPTDIPALISRANVRLNMNDRPAAVADYQKAIDADPAIDRGWLALISFYMITGQPDEAAKTGVAATEKLPNDPSVWEVLARVYIAQREKAKALDAIEKVKKISPNFMYLSTDLASANSLGASDSEIEAGYKKALEEHPNDGYSLGNLGHLYLRQGKIKESVVLFEKAVAILPQDAAAHRMLGEAYVASERYDDAKPVLDAAMALGDNTSELWFAYGVYYEHAKDLKAALHAYEIASAMVPKNPIYKQKVDSLKSANP